MMPKWRITLYEDDVFDIIGELEYLRFGAICFKDQYGDIIRLIANGEWKEVVRSPNES